MSNDELVSYMRNSSKSDKYSPVRIVNERILQVALSLIINRSKSELEMFLYFNKNNESPIFTELLSPILTNNIADFLNIKGSKLTILTNQKKLIRTSEFFKNIPTGYVSVTQVPPSISEKIEETGLTNSFVVGDKQSLILGPFDYENDANHPSFANFNDPKLSETLGKHFVELTDLCLNIGRKSDV